jgi:type II secretory pathway pseudopilin PulG
MTLVELLTALAVASILVAAMGAAFLQVVRSSDEAEAQIRAANTARLAVDVVARDLAQITPNAPDVTYLLLVNRTLTYGDRIDNDGDGQIDEEVFDGIDNDIDWQFDRDDRHAQVGPFLERPTFVGIPDFGDARVDEDCLFSADEITFLLPTFQSPTGLPQLVTYSLGSFDGENNVLLKTVEDDVGGTSPTITVEPVVFDVLSLDILAWDPNVNPLSISPSTGYWVSEWDSDLRVAPTYRPVNAPLGVPPFRLPSAFLVSVVVNADRLPLREQPDPETSGRPLKTVRATTIVNVQSTLTDPRYFAYLRQP